MAKNKTKNDKENDLHSERFEHVTDIAYKTKAICELQAQINVHVSRLDAIDLELEALEAAEKGPFN